MSHCLICAFDCRCKDSSNLNEAVAHKDDVKPAAVTGVLRDDRVSESQTVTSAGADTTADSTSTLPPSTSSTLSPSTSTLPPTLSYLVLSWEELSKCTLKNIAENTVTAKSAGAGPSEALADKFNKKEERVKVVGSKSKDAKLVGAEMQAAALRGNLFGAAADQLLATVSGSVDKDCDVLCELCAEEFAHPVTYHMRQAHPGCGRPAGGQGYNSGGNFCGGWAGSCGDGGVGGSTWYLMCDACRAKYMRDKKKVGGRKEKLVASGAVARKRASPVIVSTSSTEPHWIVYHNAMFVLELAGSSQMSAAAADWESTGLSSVSEDVKTAGAGDDVTVTFPPVPFLYLQLRGAYSEDTVFAESGDVRYCRPHTSVSGGGLDRSVSDSSRHTRHHRPYDHDVDETVSGAGKGVFQRSISETGGIGQAGESGASDNGLSLVKCPSTDMTRLIRSLEAVDNIAEYIGRLPVVSFVTQRHDLDVLRKVLTQAVRRAACRTYALHALNWLLRTISQTSCLHDLLWHFVAVLSSAPGDGDGPIDDNVADVVEADQDVAVCVHPVADVTVAGHATTRPLVAALHTFLQSVSDVLMHIPPGSAVQRMAVRCWSMQFHADDHPFLHRSHVFSHISRILSSADEAGARDVADTSSRAVIEHLSDVTQQADIKASSRQAMVAGMTDASTETFWESGDEDKNKTKTLVVSCAGLSADCRLRVVCIHVDNARDIGNKVSAVMIAAGPTGDSVEQVRQTELDQRHVGWVCAWVANSHARCVRIELRGPDNTLRVRQLKLLGESDVAPLERGAGDVSAVIQQCQCETETLSVFRLLTSLVFGRLVSDGVEPSGGDHDDVDLKEHMVGILFSHTSELTKLQRQVCAHIVRSIRLEASCVRTLWQESLMTSDDSVAAAATTVSDAYCFELLSLLLALSGSTVGRRYVAQQSSLIEDLVSLLHTASPRVQRQVVLLLRRTLPDIAPRSFASLLGITSLPPTDVAAVIRSSDVGRRGVLDVFLACIAKALSVHVKSRLPGATPRSTSVNLAGSNVLLDTEDFWWLRGSVPSQLAESMMKLLMDMSGGRFGVEWAAVTKCAVAGPIVSLSRLPSSARGTDVCLQSPVVWLALAALSVLTQEHVERLSTGRSANVTSVGSPTCDNHDDGETPATILCASGCGSLCTECDRVLHLNKRNRPHQRQVR